MTAARDPVRWAGGRVSERTFCVPAGNPSPMTLEGTNTWVWTEPGRGQCVVVDPGPDVDGHLDEVLRTCRSLGVTVAAILLTHAHADHGEGAAALSAMTGSPVLGRRAGSLSDGSLAPAGPDGPQLHVVALPGHTSDSVGVVFPDDGTVATGDLIFDRGSAMLDWPDGSLADYLATLDRLKSLVVEFGITRFLPGHGGPIADPLGQVGRYEAHRFERLAQVRRAVATLGLDVEGIVRAVYGDTGPELRDATRRTVLAQIEYVLDTAVGPRPARDARKGTRRRELPMSVTDKLNGYGPLAGVTVVELCEWVAAPAGARLLAEMGAEVIKIEPPHGDAQRTQGPGFGADRTDLEDPIFDLNNTNKNWLCIDLKTTEGMRVCKQLLAQADVFVTSLRDQALAKLGLDYESLAQEFPGLIWAQNRGYGEFGPERDTPGFDAVAWAARGGVAASFPEAGSHPAIPPQAFGDYNHSNVVAQGILAALFNRTRTGKGEKVSTNLYGTAVWGGNIGIMATQFGAHYPKSRNAVPNPFNNTYQTAEGEWVLICMPQYNKYFGMMMDILGLSEYKDDDQISTLPALKASNRQADVVKMLESAFAQKTFAEWEPILREHQVPHQKLFSYTDIINDDEAQLNDSVRLVEYDTFGTKYLPMSPVRFGSYGDPPVILSKPLGYNTGEYLRRLGYSMAEIEHLEDIGAVTCWHGHEVPDRIFVSRRQQAGEAECHW